MKAKEAAHGDLSAQDLVFCTQEHQRVVAEIGAIDLLSGDEGAELLEAVENLSVALSAFDAASAKKIAEVQALDGRANEVALHLRVRYGVHVHGCESSNPRNSCREVWNRAGAKLRAVAEAAAHGGAVHSGWLLPILEVALGNANRAAHRARSRAAEASLEEARRARMASNNPGVPTWEAKIVPHGTKPTDPADEREERLAQERADLARRGQYGA
jgi:hypothetical protein